MTMSCHSKEIWKDIQGYEGMYQVSSHGRVRSLDRVVVRPNGNGDYFAKGKIICTVLTKWGYNEVHLHKNNKTKIYKVHRLVAQAFIKNPNNLPCVNHIDENKTNNNVNNLEWCTYKYNNNYGTKKNRQGEKNKNENNPNSHKILCVNTGEIFECVKFAAEKYNISRQTISHCLNGRQKTAGKNPVTKEKLTWRYYEG